MDMRKAFSIFLERLPCPCHNLEHDYQRCAPLVGWVVDWLIAEGLILIAAVMSAFAKTSRARKRVTFGRGLSRDILVS